MSEAVLTALIGCGGSLVGAFVGAISSSRLTNYRIQELEKKVDKHNNVIKRVFKLEERTEVQEEKIAVANHRIADLETEVKHVRV